MIKEEARQNVALDSSAMALCTATQWSVRSWITRLWIAGLCLARLCLARLCLASLLLTPTMATAQAPPALPNPDLSDVEPQVATRIQERRRQVTERTDSSPATGAAWGAFGMSLDVHGFKTEALHCYEQAANLDPTERRWPYFRAILLAELSWPEASEWFERARALAPKYKPLLIRLGNHQLVTGDLIAARATFGAASGTQRELATHAHFGLARTALAMGNSDDAVVQARRALAAEPRHRDARNLLAELLRQHGDDEQAETERRRAQQTESTISLPDPLAVTLLEEGVSSYWHQKRGRLYLIGGDFARAAEEFQQALGVAPRAEFHAGLGEALLRLGKAREAETHLQASLALRPDSAPTLTHLGFALWQLGEPESAIPVLEKAVSLPQGDRAATLDVLAAAYEASGQLEQAATIARRAQERAIESEQTELAKRIGERLERCLAADVASDEG